MSIKLHMTVSYSILIVLGGVFAWLYMYSGQAEQLQANPFTTFLIAALFIGFVDFALGAFLPAKCPSCGQRTFPKGRNPVKYFCPACEHVEVTRVRFGNQRANADLRRNR